VMIEEDYLALKNNMNNFEIKTDKLNEKEVKDINNFSLQIMKEMVLPVIEEEINQGKNFAYLRQIYYSLILAVWFKKKLKESIDNSPKSEVLGPEPGDDRQQATGGHVLEKIYLDKKKIEGIDTEDKKIKQKIYNQYLEAYKKGVYNYIKRDYDVPSQKYIQRRYYSGGMDLRGLSSSALSRQSFPSDFYATISSSSLSEVEVVLSPELGGQDPDLATREKEKSRKLSILRETKEYTLREETIKLLNSIREILKGFNSQDFTAKTKAAEEASQRTNFPREMFAGAQYDENLDVVYITQDLWDEYIGRRIAGRNISGISIVPDSMGLLDVLHEKRHSREIFLTGGIEGEISAYWGSLVDLIEFAANGNNEAFRELERIAAPQGREKELTTMYPEDVQRRAVYLEYHRIIQRLFGFDYAEERKNSLEADPTCTNENIIKMCDVIYNILIKNPGSYNKALIPEQLDRFKAARFIELLTISPIIDSSSSSEVEGESGKTDDGRQMTDDGQKQVFLSLFQKDLSRLEKIVQDITPINEDESFKETIFLMFGAEKDNSYSVERIIPVEKYTERNNLKVIPNKQHIIDLINMHAQGKNKLVGVLCTHPFSITKIAIKPGPSWMDRLEKDILPPELKEKIVNNPLGVVIEPHVPSDLFTDQLGDFTPDEFNVYFYLPRQNPEKGAEVVKKINFNTWIEDEPGFIKFKKDEVDGITSSTVEIPSKLVDITQEAIKKFNPDKLSQCVSASRWISKKLSGQGIIFKERTIYIPHNCGKKVEVGDATDSHTVLEGLYNGEVWVIDTQLKQFTLPSRNKMALSSGFISRYVYKVKDYYMHVLAFSVSVAGIDRITDSEERDTKIKSTSSAVEGQTIFDRNTVSSPTKTINVNKVDSTPGGIDLNPDNLDLEIKGEGINFQNIDVPFDIQNFQGFTFQIVKIQRIKNSRDIFSAQELTSVN